MNLRRFAVVLGGMIVAGSAVGSATAKVHRGFPSPRTSNLKKSIETTPLAKPTAISLGLRGGDGNVGDLPPTFLPMCVYAFVQSAVVANTAQVGRLDEKTKVQPGLVQALVDIWLFKLWTMAATVLQLSFCGQDKFVSVGIGYVVGAAGVAESLLAKNIPKHFGFNAPGLAMELLIHVAAAAIALLAPNNPKSLIALKTIASFGLLNGLVGGFQPITFAKVWGLSEKEANDKVIQQTTRKISLTIVASCITMLGALWDAPPFLSILTGALVLAYAGIFSCAFVFALAACSDYFLAASASLASYVSK